jgi:hypothetical protein
MTAVGCKEVTFREFIGEWSLGRIIERDPTSTLPREEVRDRVLRRAFADHEFKEQLFANTRYVMAMAIDQGVGINQSFFLMGIRKYHLVEETASLMYMKIPRCHRGCTMLPIAVCPTEDRSNCQVCGAPNGKSACGGGGTECTAGSLRTRIEDSIVDLFYRDREFAQRLNTDPLPTYLNYARKVCGGALPRYLLGVRELVLVEESSSEMYLIFPTRERFEAERDLAHLTEV